MNKATLQKNWKSITLVLFILNILALLLPVYSAMGEGANVFTLFDSAFFPALLLLLMPILGVVFTAAVGQNMPQKQKSIVSLVLFALCLLMPFICKGMVVSAIADEAGMGGYASLLGSFISLGFGSILIIIFSALGIVLDILTMSGAPAQTTSAYTSYTASQQAAPQTGSRFCQQCGAQVDAGQKFCQQCGAKMDE